MSRASILAALTGVWLAVLVTPAAIEGPVRVPANELPAPVSKLGELSGLTALAISDDGATAAGAFAAEKAGRSVLRLSRGAGTGESPADIAIRGRIRSLRFSRDGADLFVVAWRDSKREEAFLLRINVETRELSREIVLPRGASDVDTIDASTLIVVSPNELRTFFVPSLTSGPLYRLDGNNRAVAAVPGTRRLLVAGDDSILLVDLDDPQTRDGLSARERLAVATPVVSLAVAPDGREALARHEDGKVERFTVEPLGSAIADGNAVVIAWPGSRQDAPPPAPRYQPLPDVPTETVPPPPAESHASRTEPPSIASPPPPSGVMPQSAPPTTAEVKPPVESPNAGSSPPPETPPPQANSQRAPETESPPPSGPAQPGQPEPPAMPAESAAPPQAVPPAPPPDAVPAPKTEPPASQQTPDPSPPSEPPTAQPEAAPVPPAELPPQSQPAPQPPDIAPPPAPAAGSQSDASAAEPVVLRGSVTGAAAPSIVAVVILGPDNLLHEAARAKPSADGSWSVTGLAPGTYRIQLDAGSGGAVEASPAFLTVRIGRTGSTQVAPIEARRVSTTR